MGLQLSALQARISYSLKVVFQLSFSVASTGALKCGMCVCAFPLAQMDAQNDDVTVWQLCNGCATTVLDAIIPRMSNPLSNHCMQVTARKAGLNINPQGFYVQCRAIHNCCYRSTVFSSCHHGIPHYTCHIMVHFLSIQVHREPVCKAIHGCSQNLKSNEVEAKAANMYQEAPESSIHQTGGQRCFWYKLVLRGSLSVFDRPFSKSTLEQHSTTKTRLPPTQALCAPAISR